MAEGQAKRTSSEYTRDRLTGRAGRRLHPVIGSDVLGPPDGLATPVDTDLAARTRTHIRPLQGKGYRGEDPARRPAAFLGLLLPLCSGHLG